jgi:hypothetical protein
VLLDGLLEHSFNVIGSGEVSKVVDVDAEEQGRLTFNEAASEDAGVVFARFKADGNEGVAEGGVPVTGATAETIKGLLEEPEFIWFAEGATRGRTDNDGLVGRQIRVTESVLAVALLLGSADFNGHGCEKTAALLSENRGKGVALGPGGVLVVAEDGDTALSTNGSAKFIGLDGLDDHGLDGLDDHGLDGLDDHGREDGNVLVFRAVLRKADWHVSFVVFEADVFLRVRVEPDGTIGGVGFHGLSEGVGGPIFEFGSGDVVGARGRGPAKGEGAIEDAGAPGRGEIAEIMGENGCVMGIALGEGPATGSINEKMAAPAAVVNDESDTRVIVDPLGKAWELRGRVKVTIDGEHGVIGGCHVEGTDVEGVIATSGKEAIPFGGGSGDIKNGALIDFAVNQGKSGTGGRERLLRRGTAGDEGAGKTTVVDEVRERVGKVALGI